MRYFPKNKKKDVVINVHQCISHTFVRQPSLVDSFYREDVVDPVTGLDCKVFHNPLYMLFNQERLDRMGAESVQQWIQSMTNAGNSQLSEVRKKCTDEDLLHMVRSRHIQHPAEFERYLDELNSRADKFNSEIARVRAEMQSEADRVDQMDVEP